MRVRNLLAGLQLHRYVHLFALPCLLVDQFAEQQKVHFALQPEEVAPEHVLTRYQLLYLQVDLLVLLHLQFFTFQYMPVVELYQIVQPKRAGLFELKQSAVDEKHVIQHRLVQLA